MRVADQELNGEPPPLTQKQTITIASVISGSFSGGLAISLMATLAVDVVWVLICAGILVSVMFLVLARNGPLAATGHAIADSHGLIRPVPIVYAIATFSGLAFIFGSAWSATQPWSVWTQLSLSTTLWLTAALLTWAPLRSTHDIKGLALMYVLLLMGTSILMLGIGAVVQQDANPNMGLATMLGLGLIVGTVGEVISNLRMRRMGGFGLAPQDSSRPVPRRYC